MIARASLRGRGSTPDEAIDDLLARLAGLPRWDFDPDGQIEIEAVDLWLSTGRVAQYSAVADICRAILLPGT